MKIFPFLLIKNGKNGKNGKKVIKKKKELIRIFDFHSIPLYVYLCS